MATTKSWINAARPRTLPLALSGILMGCGLALYYGAMDAGVSFLAMVTATFIQVFSNFANDYGDSQKGTDNQNRIGPVRTMQSGEISKKQMEWGMLVAGGLSLVFGILLVYIAVWHSSKSAFFLFIGLGVLSILAAYFYTAGKKSYGYIGLGDLFVFLFFGLLPVLGSFFLNSGFLKASIVLPALSMGMFSTGVLNLNNMRDIVNDRHSGKITIPVRIGPGKSRYYHSALILGGWVSAIVFTLIQQRSAWQWLYLALLPLYLFDLYKVIRIKNNRELDPFLKRLALSAFAFTVLFITGLILSGR